MAKQHYPPASSMCMEVGLSLMSPCVEGLPSGSPIKLRPSRLLIRIGMDSVSPASLMLWAAGAQDSACLSVNSFEKSYARFVSHCFQ